MSIHVFMPERCRPTAIKWALQVLNKPIKWIG